MVSRANPLYAVHELGQGVWLDHLERELLRTGDLQRLVDVDTVTGLTSNPRILEKAIRGRDLYQRALREAVAADPDAHADTLFSRLISDDLREAADTLAPVHQATRGRAGFVSVEVSPNLAYDTDATIQEAQRLCRELGRPNVMVKVPATEPGLLAVERLIEEGVPVNVTLLFSVARYRQAADAYLRGLEARLRRGLPLGNVRSVASFCLSRLDTVVDAQLEALLGRDAAHALQGEAAVANAKLAYQAYKRLDESERLGRLRAAGAHPQRLLWASTGTENPAYSDVKYVESLIGPDTITAMPLHTLEAFQEHGRVRPTLEHGVDHAQAVMDRLADAGIDFGQVTGQVADDAVADLAKSFHTLLEGLDEQARALRKAWAGAG